MKLFVGLLALMLAVGGIAFAVYRAAPAGAECSNRVLSEIASPDGKFVAASFERLCGAQTATAVGMRLAASPPGLYEERDTVFVAPGKVPVRVFWREELALVIESPAQTIAREDATWRKVQVTLRRLR